jgi:hypothetical protein
MIRGKSKSCPFGLSIPSGCNKAGGEISEAKRIAILDMVPIDSANSEKEAEEILEDNLEIMLMLDEDRKCPFADVIYENKRSVDCKYDEKQPSMPAGNVGLNGSPLYPHTMVGNMPEAQYGYPLDYYSDNNESRNVYYGLYSLIG